MADKNRMQYLWLEACSGHSWNEAAHAIIQKLKDAGVQRGQIVTIDAHNNGPSGAAMFSAHYSLDMPGKGSLEITYDAQNGKYGWPDFYKNACAKAHPEDVISITCSCNSSGLGSGVTYVFSYADPSGAPPRELTWKEARASSWKAAADAILQKIKDSGAQRGQVVGIDAHNDGPDRDAFFSAILDLGAPEQGELDISYDWQNTRDGWPTFYKNASDFAEDRDVVSMTSSCNSGRRAVFFVFYQKATSSYRMKDPEGDEGVFTGEVNRDGRAHGSGEIRYDDGYHFVGLFRNGEMEEGAGYGEGKLEWTMTSGKWTDMGSPDHAVASRFPEAPKDSEGAKLVKDAEAKRKAKLVKDAEAKRKQEAEEEKASESKGNSKKIQEDKDGDKAGEVTFEVTGLLGLRYHNDTGVVDEIAPGGQAYNLGVRDGWRMVRIDGLPFSKSLYEAKKSASRQITFVNPVEVSFKVTGLLGVRYHNATGVVDEVAPGGQAYTLGVRDGWRMVRIDGQPFSKSLYEAKKSASRQITFVKAVAGSAPPPGG
jgi:hypothetical protein